jgi:hypothetical protein
MTRDQIKSLLLSNDRAVERAIVVLYHCQTVDEQHTSSTQHLNGRGFNAFHAPSGTYYAKWVISGRRLTGRHLEAARRMACHYARQLAELSELPASPRPQPSPVGVLITGTDMAHLLRQHDKFQVFPGLTQHRQLG